MTRKATKKKATTKKKTAAKKKPAVRAESGKRNPDGTFKKGVSGNPSGGPKKTELMRQVERMALEACPGAIKRTVEIAQKCTDARVRLRANEILMDRGLGKARQQIDLDAKVKHVEDIKEMTEAELLAVLQEEGGAE